jgi:hypothetical protein
MYWELSNGIDSARTVDKKQRACQGLRNRIFINALYTRYRGIHK